MGPQAFRLLRTYWSWLRVVAKAGGCYSSSFQGFRGVTQGYPLSPTIFNLVVYSMVKTLVEVMVEGAD